MKVLILSFFLLLSQGQIIDATSSDGVNAFKVQNKNEQAALLFYTPRTANVLNLFGLFSKDEVDSGIQTGISDLVPTL